MNSDSDSPPAVPDEQRLPLRVLKIVNSCFARGYHQLNVLSPCPLPDKGAAILVCNHISTLDPVLVQSVSKRLIVWMMAREYYDVPGLGWLFRSVKAIPVDRRGRDLTATRAALRALANGNVLGVFPEGRIEANHKLLPFQTGVAMIAARTKVSVYPAYLEGTQRGKGMVRACLESQQSWLSFGKKIDLPGLDHEKPALEAATNVIESAVSNLRQHVVRASLGKNS